MSERVTAVFQSGAFYPAIRPEFADGEEVELLVWPRRLKKPSEVAAELARAASLPVTGSGDPLTSQNHDVALYGKALGHE